MKSGFINGINIYTPESRIELIEYAIFNRKILVAVNAEKILHATSKSRSIINKNVGYPDGMGAVWSLRKKGYKNVMKIPGCELWLDIIKHYHSSKTFYLVGGEKEVIEATVMKLKKEYKGIEILNYRNGFLRNNNEKEKLIKDIIEKRPDVVFVAMGSPLQELLMVEMQKKHQATYQGLGGSFDVYTGYVHRAPKWWVRNSLEWCHRLLSQPLRIKKQIHLIRFFILLRFNKF
ncbi:WecB/TagA/CpsF family glycosyltransferase [Flavobacterium sp. LAR06]|uniref:WecB/TagA/CpsF family glycosyltransferase n=1 Tax=Flavobacterium sp. LAR06 TaxID=3064897 RepID=UPI0035C00628